MKLINLLVPTLWVSDTIATCVFVSVGGVELEANPIMHWLIAEHGLYAFILTKLIILALWLSLANKIHWVIHAALGVILFPIVCMGILLITSL